MEFLALYSKSLLNSYLWPKGSLEVLWVHMCHLAFAQMDHHPISSPRET